MDLIRTYCEIAFAKVANRWLRHRKAEAAKFPARASFILDRNSFLDEARISHPEISDDSLSLIYRLGIDEWSRYGMEKDDHEEGNIMRVIANLAKSILEEANGIPRVLFRHLFRWREVTQLIGEDLFTCALLAYNDKDSADCNRRFDWPSVVHNDNPDLNFLFQSKGLCELHSHLMASTNIFEISWVSLMNEICHKERAFSKLGNKHEPSRVQALGEKVYDAIKTSAVLRWRMYEFAIRQTPHPPFNLGKESLTIEQLDSATSLERNSFSEKWIPDYIVQSPDSPMSVYAGERYFLYTVLRWIYSTNDPDLTDALYQYLLSKSLLRKYMVQINSNIGFSNFQRFQDIKMEFMGKGYASLPTSLPLWEASQHNFTNTFESRIVPSNSKKEYLRRGH